MQGVPPPLARHCVRTLAMIPGSSNAALCPMSEAVVRAPWVIALIPLSSAAFWVSSVRSVAVRAFERCCSTNAAMIAGRSASPRTSSVTFVPRMQWSIAVANLDTIADSPDLVEAVLRGCRRSYRYAADNRDEWADFGARYFGVPRETMVDSIAREFHDLHFDCAVDLEGLNAVISLQRKLGAVSRPLRVDEIVDFRFQH